MKIKFILYYNFGQNIRIFRKINRLKGNQTKTDKRYKGDSFFIDIPKAFDRIKIRLPFMYLDSEDGKTREQIHRSLL
mgnify:CR=1 FL=1